MRRGEGRRAMTFGSPFTTARSGRRNRWSAARDGPRRPVRLRLCSMPESPDRFGWLGRARDRTIESGFPRGMGNRGPSRWRCRAPIPIGLPRPPARPPSARTKQHRTWLGRAPGPTRISGIAGSTTTKGFNPGLLRRRSAALTGRLQRVRRPALHMTHRETQSRIGRGRRVTTSGPAPENSSIPLGIRRQRSTTAVRTQGARRHPRQLHSQIQRRDMPGQMWFSGKTP